MLRDGGKSAAMFAGRKAVRMVRAVGSPVVNFVKRGQRQREGLALPTDRRNMAEAVGLRSALEIGPFFTPSLIGANVSYFDVLDRTALRDRAASIGGDPADVPHIDFVSPTGNLAIVDRKFEVVFSSHVIEHQPDLIKHLQDVADVLHSGGEYFLIVPDKRYSFDNPFNESSFASIKDAYSNGHKIHSPDNIAKHFTKAGHNNAFLHWFGWHARAKTSPAAEQRARSGIAKAGNGEYVDVHAWMFTPFSLKALLEQLYLEKLIRFKTEYVTQTAFGRLEFFVRLKLD